MSETLSCYKHTPQTLQVKNSHTRLSITCSPVQCVEMAGVNRFEYDEQEVMEERETAWDSHSRSTNGIGNGVGGMQLASYTPQTLQVRDGHVWSH